MHEREESDDDCRCTATRKPPLGQGGQRILLPQTRIGGRPVRRSAVPNCVRGE